MAAPRVPAGSRLPNHDLPGADAVGVELGHCVRLCEAGWEIPHPQLRGARHAWATAWATTPLITNYGCTMHAFDAMYKNCGGPWFCMEREKHSTLCVTDKVWPTTVLPISLGFAWNMRNRIHYVWLTRCDRPLSYLIPQDPQTYMRCVCSWMRMMLCISLSYYSHAYCLCA